MGVERTEDVSDPMDDVGESVRAGGGVADFKSGSKGELDGEAKGASLIGKVNARGVGEMIATVGGGGTSVETSSAVRCRIVVVSTMISLLSAALNGTFTHFWWWMCRGCGMQA